MDPLVDSSSSSSSDDSLTEVLEEASEQYVGQWHRLVSTTNWEKGRIIYEWRTALIEAGAPASQYSDEAWSRRIGNVSGQHVGRLRRVYERFGQVRQQYEGLFWSHFQAAIDWNDAEMWLEGALQNGWSVSRMRQMRWEALGGTQPRDDEIVEAEVDEDFVPLENPHEEPIAGVSVGAVDEPSDGADDQPAGEPIGPAHRTDAADDLPAPDGPTDEQPPWDAPEPAMPAARFEEIDFDRWPDDLAEAFDSLKLAIVRHRMSGWEAIDPHSVLAALKGLEQLVLAPASTT